MKVAAIKAMPFTFPHDWETVSYCIVRLETDDGVVGYGEACDSFGCTYGPVIDAAIGTALAPLLVGEPVEPIDRLVAKMRGWTRRRLGDQWVAMQAISAVELALWDAAGKAHGAPVAELLGTTTDPVSVYASSMFLGQGDAAYHLDLLEPMLSRGVGALKLRLGVDWEADLETLAAIIDRLGDSIEVAIDGSENFTVATGLQIAERLALLGISWFEEPVPQHRRASIAELAAASPVPISYGEHLFGVHDFEACLNWGEATVLQPDPATAGGLLEAMAIAELGASRHARVVPHSAAGPVALAPAIHLGAAAPTISLIEYPYPLADCWERVAPGARLLPEHIVDGALAVPDGPGLGVEIDETAIGSLPYQPPPPRSGLAPQFQGDV